MCMDLYPETRIPAQAIPDVCASYAILMDGRTSPNLKRLKRVTGDIKLSDVLKKSFFSGLNARPVAESMMGAFFSTPKWTESREHKEATKEYFKKLLHCSNLECDSTEQRERQFSRCAACNQAWYCSRACQKSHWKTGHRAICKAKSQRKS
eukprot:69846_1